jgi:tripartite-type tricarboxylate transporter receptor subunit TctC
MHVPYRGSPPALTDLLGGQVQVNFTLLPPAIEHIRAGLLRALAVTSAKRSPTLPDIPTVAEFLPNYEASSVWGFGVPTGTPAQIIDKLNREINAALSDVHIQTTLADLGASVLTHSPAEFGRLMADETEKWAKVIRFANIKPE